MGYEHILYDTRESIATITLNRPDRLNAWTATMNREVHEAVADAARDDSVRVIVLTGAGRGFCAGADMDLLSGISAGAVARGERPQPFDPASRPDFQTTYAFFPAVPKPVIAAINGPVAGLGLVIALYCDLRIAAETAIVTTAFSRRGLVAEHGISWTLPRLVGLASALDLMLSARKIDAAEALRMGLYNRVLPAGELTDGVRAYARELATLVSPRSMRIMKRQLWDAQFQTLAEATAVADAEMRQSFDAEDFKEGVAHFVEKRAPRFTGR
jgi:enoyl-CoA hydratase/carnithine racemase